MNNLENNIINDSIWRFKDKYFNTKLERDLYVKGWNDATKEHTARRNEFNILEDI